jgi:hypothetical protein
MTEKRIWSSIIAAALILVGGAVFINAETINLEVEVEDGSSATVEVIIDGESQTFTVDDLAEGEERTFEAGDHTVLIRRAGDDIEVLLDGDEIGAHMHGGGKQAHKMIVMSGDFGEAHAERMFISEGGAKVKVVKVGEGEDFVWHGEDGDAEEILVELKEHLGDGEAAKIDVFVEELGGEHDVYVLKTGEGEGMHPKVIELAGPHAGMVKYRCDETGSVLMVKEENATFDSFVDPASGCLLKKVDTPDEHVMIIKKKVTIVEDEE